MAQTYRKEKIENLKKDIEFMKKLYLERITDGENKDFINYWKGQVNACDFFVRKINKEFDLS